MNHNQRYAWVQGRLARWGHWIRSGVRGLGYPSMTAEAKLLYSPGRSTKPHPAPEYTPDPDSAELELLIRQLTPKCQLAVWCKYAQECKTARAVVICGAEGRGDYYRLLEQAERDLASLIRACA